MTNYYNSSSISIETRTQTQTESRGKTMENGISVSVIDAKFRVMCDYANDNDETRTSKIFNQIVGILHMLYMLDIITIYENMELYNAALEVLISVEC